MKIAQIAQRATNLDRAVVFYSHLLGQEVSARFDPPGLAFFNLEGTRLLLDRGAPSALIYFAVDDVRSKTEELRAMGIQIAAEPHVIFTHENPSIGPIGTNEWMAFIVDSEGNTVGLVSWAPSKA